MKQEKVALKTMAMKARVINFLRKELYPYSDNEFQIKYKNKTPLTDLVKLDIFDKLYPVLLEMSNDLRYYKIKRRNKAEIERLREERKQLPNN